MKSRAVQISMPIRSAQKPLNRIGFHFPGSLLRKIYTYISVFDHDVLVMIA